VRIETPKGDLTGCTVLSTVSTGILASSDIRFTPDLPTWKTEDINNLPMGTENKMGIHFNTDVFGADGRGHYSIWNDDGNSAKVDVSVMGFKTAVVFVVDVKAFGSRNRANKRVMILPLTGSPISSVTIFANT
jgi:monoamine oxidase